MSASHEAKRAVFRRLQKEDVRFQQMYELLVRDMEEEDILELWYWFEKQLDTKEAHEEAAAVDAVVMEERALTEGWDV